MSTSKAVKAPKKDTLPSIPDSSHDEWEGMGAENATQDDLLMPFISIAQALSPQLDSSEPNYIEGLEQGMFFNSATGQVYGKEITVVPTYFERKWLEFKVREEGGGLVEIHDSYDEKALTRRDDMNRSINDEGNQIVDSRSFYCMVFSDGNMEPAVISMKATQAKKARQWMTLIRNEQWTSDSGRRFTAPMFANTYNLSSIKEKNDKGSWYGYVVSKGDSMLPEDCDERFNAAHDFYKLLKSGGVKVDYAAEDGAKPVEDDDELPMQ